jgi:uncharacterized protein (DUF1330 family)
MATTLRLHATSVKNSAPHFNGQLTKRVPDGRCSAWSKPRLSHMTYGGKFVRGGGALPGGLENSLSIVGDPPKSVVLFRFESLDKAQEWSNSAAWRDATSYFRYMQLKA